jgi:hypothetical protein
MKCVLDVNIPLENLLDILHGKLGFEILDFNHESPVSKLI